MRSAPKRLTSVATAIVALLSARAASARDPLELMGAGPGHPPAGDVGLFSFSDLARGWDGFLDGWRIVDMVVVFLLAMGLGAALAYHPAVRRKATTIEELEQPKTFIMYALVGAVISILVQVNSVMAVVVFGIGGLLRFRTDVGQAKDTGRVILATIVGLCCGMKLFVPAVLATSFGWGLVYYLERETLGKLLVKNLERERIVQAAEAYRRILLQAGCRILGERKKFTKGQVTFVFKAPYTLDKEHFEQHYLSAVPEELRGAVDWDIS